MQHKKRRLLQVLGIGVCLWALVWTFTPPGHVSLYDANLVRLAETELQGYCAGDTYWKSGGMGDATVAATCRKANAKKYSDKVNLLVVGRAFCQAIVDNGWDGTIDDCRGILASNQYWPTYDGGISNQWNRARPYPGTLVDIGSGQNPQGTSRTGGHQGNTRNGDAGMRP